MRIINNLIFIALTVMVTLFNSCFDQLNPPNSVKAPPLSEGMGYVEIRIAESEARTLFPDNSGVLGISLDYKIIITKDNAATPAVNVVFDGNRWKGELEPGNYTVEVIASKHGTSQVAAIGNIKLLVIENNVTNVTVVMFPPSTGSGTFSYMATIPGNIIVKNIGFRFESFSEGIESIPKYVNSTALSGSMNLTSGYYRMFLEIICTDQGQTKIYRIISVVYIGDNLVTAAVYNITVNDLYVPDDLYMVANSTELNTALTGIRTSSKKEFSIMITGSFNSDPISLSTGFDGKTIRVSGVDNDNYEIRLQSRGSLFTVSNNVTLKLERIILRGITEDKPINSIFTNNSSLLNVSNGTVVLNSGAKITDNEMMSSGGGVYVGSGGTLTISGGTITGNKSNDWTLNSDYPAYCFGGGVYVGNGGTLTMIEGNISNNIVDTSAYYNKVFSHGGGVYVDNNGIFNMKGGTISGNTSSAKHGQPTPTLAAYGGGVYVNSGNFKKTGGTITDNFVKIDGNTQSNCGKMVYVNSGKRRETTAGPTVNLDSNVEGSAGGWE